MKSNLNLPWLKILLLIVVTLAMWLPRGLELDRFVTTDEPKWLTRSANFFYALAQGEYEYTYQKEHPGVTIMWAGTAGFLSRYPYYVKETSRQESRPQRLATFLRNRNYEPVQILEAGRIFVVLGIVMTLALAFLAGVRLIGLFSTFVGFLLIAFDPFSIALSRLLHLDGLVSALMLLSLLSIMNFLYRGHRPLDLVHSAVAAGLAWLTKSPSLFLLTFFGLLCLIEIGRSRFNSRLLRRVDIWQATWPLIAWTGIAAFVFVLLWPAMWVDPVGSLQKVIGEAASYAAKGHHAPTFFNGQIFPAGTSDWRFYPINYLWRTTPSVLIGLGLTLFALLFRRRLSFPKEQQQATIVLLLFAGLYTAFMTFGAKKFDRYLLPVFAPLALVAAIGWVVVAQNALQWITFRWHKGRKSGKILPFGVLALLTAVILIQLAGVVQTYPYYFSYYNPLMGGNKKAPDVMMIGWGEGLDQAARYLNAKPNAQNLRVQSWYPIGSFSYFFIGKTIIKDFEANLEALANAHYYVLYFHQWQRQRPGEEFIHYFNQQEPEYIVRINGLEYARIYRRAETPP